MPQGVTSGRGRNGPWLQNAWLRVETRLGDGSISPVALSAFRPAEKAHAYVALVDGDVLSFGRSDYDDHPYRDLHGDGRALTLTSRDARRGVTLRREIVLYDAHPFCVVRAAITNEGRVPLRVASLHVFATPPQGRGRLQVGASAPDDWRIFRNGWQSWSPTMSFGGAQHDVRSAPHVLSPQPPQREPGRFASDDVGVIFDPASGRALLAGAISARDLLTQIFVDAPARHIDAHCLTDGLAVHPGETLWSERIAVDVCGHPNEQLERYGDALAREMGARAPQNTPSGWCSWYYYYTTVTEDDVVRNLRFLESHRRELPIDTVQIDDGYQADISDWLTVNEKFPHGMKWLASEIKAAGFTPGIWLAPFLVAHSSKTFAAHPEWVVRDDRGEPVVAIGNWQRDNYALDGTNPDALAWLTSLFEEICDGWGYDYVKIDFLFAAAVAGIRRDPSATRIRAYRQALEAVRKGAGDSRFILGCGSLMAPSVGYFDGNRIGPDVAPFWRNLTTAERAEPRPRARRPDDGLSAETSIRNTLTRAWMHGRLWANDPDCVLVREDRTKLSLDEVRTLASAVGLTGGMTLVSDDLTQLSPDRIDLLSMLLPPLPRSATPCDLMLRDMPERLDLAFDRDFDPLRIVGLFNFDDEAKDIVVALPEGRWHAFELWSERYLGVVEREMSLSLVEAHACRVVALRPAADAAMLVATNAHIGMGALDVTGVVLSEGRSNLTLQVGLAGRRQRKLFVAAAGHEIAGVTVGGAAAPFDASGPLCVVPLTVERPAEVRIAFR
jgi:alpha-galactosidase